jgi:hypothetical protein
MANFKVKAILVDIDGTISDAAPRAKKYLKKGKEDWDAFYNACGTDLPIWPIIGMVQVLSGTYDIIFCSGRRESCREATLQWIKDHVALSENCTVNYIFRNDGDHRHDTIVKPEKLDAYMKEHPETEIAFILEDRNSMVAKWRELGYTCVQVADGNF